MDQIYIGNFSKGLTKNRLPFNIDNDAFPMLYNFYIWRGRAKRKRGTYLLGQLENQIEMSQTPNNWQVQAPILNELTGQAYNLISGFSLGSSASITPGSIEVTGVIDGTTYTDPAGDGVLVATGGTGTGGTINYASGLITIYAGGGQVITGTFSYYPGLPVMGLEDLVKDGTDSNFPLLLSFDTDFAYQFNESASPKYFYSVSYYKGSNNPVEWHGQDYQQFWSTNYQGAFWATNNNPGMLFENISTITVGNPTIITTASAHGLVTGDYVWFNEITGADAGLLNYQTLQITKTGANTFTVAVDTTGKAINNSGIFQTLTATPPGITADGIKWYDGDPTSGTGYPTTTNYGWVNFAPPLTATTTGIVDFPANLYYLVGALMITPFKDRLLFFSPWVQTSTGQPIQLPDTVIWSWNGTPYYTTSGVSPNYTSVLVPTNQTANPTAYYVDETGKGGYLSSGLDQNIVTISDNEDVILVGFTGRQTRFVYTGNDFSPFLFFNINSELGSSCTFSSISLDRGGIAIGSYGVTMTTQQSSQRIDLDIPDEVFSIMNENNGNLRVNSARDFYREWIYFCYPSDSSTWKFPTRTFLYNYREGFWGVLYENFTAHGRYRSTDGYTWATVPFESWNTWTETWNSGVINAEFPVVVGGNPQGYVLVKGQGTGEGNSGTIIALSQSSTGNTQINSINHCVEQGDYLYFTGFIFTSVVDDTISNIVGMVIEIVDANNFIVDINYPTYGSYLGNGKYARLSQPLLQTKQFPIYWQEGRQVRLGTQQYLMDFTSSGQCTVNIYLSMDPTNAWNDPLINVAPNSLLYSQLMYTCPESSNIGLTPANTNLQMPTASSQKQIWHRFNTSLQGDSVQIGITLSDTQMRDLNLATAELSLHGIVLNVSRGPLLA